MKETCENGSPSFSPSNEGGKPELEQRPVKLCPRCFMLAPRHTMDCPAYVKRMAPVAAEVLGIALACLGRLSVRERLLEQIRNAKPWTPKTARQMGDLIMPRPGGAKTGPLCGAEVQRMIDAASKRDRKAAQRARDPIWVRLLGASDRN